MNSTLSISILTIFGLGQAQANQCTSNNSNNNVLVKSIQSFTDTSPFFKSNKLYSYKANSWDIDIDDYSINKYDNKLKLTGNTWKMLRLDTDYTLTPNSVLEFEFKSIGDEAEINGIGLIMHGASGFNGSRFFQVHGTQVASTYNQDYHNYSGNKWVRYQIPLWDSTSNTNEKRLQLLVFAGDDDNTQVNQNIHYKNVRIVEGIQNYQLPSGFQHSGLNIESTSNKHIKNHVYYQTILGSDNNTYPVSGGQVTKVMYEPAGTNTSYILTAQEHYYQSLCWDAPINYTKSEIENEAYNRMLTLASTENVGGYNTSGSGDLSITTEQFFDPDFTIEDLITVEPSFITSLLVTSPTASEHYYDRIKASNLQGISNGFFVLSANNNQKSTDCNNPKTGTTTLGVCLDLTDRTKPISSTEFHAFSTLSEVLDDNIDHTTDPIIVKDQDDKWSEDLLKQQTTELLVNMSIVNDFFEDVMRQSYSQITGFKLKAIVNNIYSNSGAKFDLDELATAYRPANFIDAFGYNTTWTRDPSIVGHEFTHGITNNWYGISIATVEKQGCAINEAFSDIMGAGAKRNDLGFYQSNFAVDIYNSQTPKPEGLRNFAAPSSTNGDSVYVGNDANIPGDCFGPPQISPPTCVDWNAQHPGVPCPYNWDGYATKSFYAIGNVITHLYHLMVTGGFNADATFKPDNFGISADEVYNHKSVEGIFFTALKNENSVGHSIKFCELRDRMLRATANAYYKTSIQQAWKHVYKDIQTICALPDDITLFHPQIEIKIDNTVYSDGDLVEMGTASHGQTIEKTLLIKNTGDYPLRMINPTFSNSKFDQTLLSSSQFKVDVNETVSLTLEFTASASDPTVNSSSFTFETNLPNGTEDQHFFNLNLRALSVPLQGNADAYEDDDTLNTASLMDNNSSFQQRNFEDDNIDYIELINLTIQGQKLSCGMQLRNLGSSRNFCINRYNKTGEYLNTDCQQVDTNFNMGVNFAECSDPNNCELVDLGIANQNGANANSEYTLSHSCIVL